MTSSARRTVINVASICTVFATGFSGLVYEVTWQRYLSNIIGSHAKASAIVLAVFLGGLSLGYLLFGQLSRRKAPRALMKLCGFAEIGIGAWALLFPVIFSAVSQRVGATDPASGVSLFWDMLIACGLIGLPCTLMGCTLPLLTQALSSGPRQSPRMHAFVYGINTAGAFAGCLTGGFFLLPWLGLPLTSMAMGVVSLTGGLILTALSSLLPDTEPAPDYPSSAADQLQHTSGLAPGAAMALAAIAGFAAITLQTALIRVAGLSLGSSEYTFTVIVAAYLLLLALGALRVGANRNRGTSDFVVNQLFALAGIMAFYLAAPYIPYAVLLVRTSFTSTPVTFYAYYATCFALFSLLVLVLGGCLGRTMPLLFSLTAPEWSKTGHQVGALYFANAVGCVLGALVGGYIALRFLNLDGIFKLAVLAAGLILCILAAGQRALSKKAQILATSGAALAMLFSVFMPAWSPDDFAIGFFRSQQPFQGLYSGVKAAREVMTPKARVLGRRDDPNSSVSVIEQPAPPGDGSPFIRALLVNGKSDGSTGGEEVGGDALTVRLLAHLPALLSRATDTSAAVIGFGTGMTAGSLTLHPGIKRIEAIEISDGVRDFAPMFSFANHDVVNNSKFHWIAADAYRVLSTGARKYGLIISEPSNPWVTGVERLYSTEFFQRALDALEQGGIYAQWFHTYSISDETFKMVVHTFAGVFPNVRIFKVDEDGVDIILLGSRHQIDGSDIARARERLAAGAVRQELGSLGFSSIERLLSLEAPILPTAFAQAATHTLDFPKLAFSAGRDFFLGSTTSVARLMAEQSIRPWVAAGRRAALLRDALSGGQAQRTETLIDLARFACKSKVLPPTTDAQTWKPRCRLLLRGLAAAGLLPPATPADTPAELSVFRDLSQVSSTVSSKIVPAGSAVARARLALRVFNLGDSVYFPMLHQRLLAYVAPCFLTGASPSGQNEAAACRLETIDALVSHGHPRAALPYLAKLAKLNEQWPDTAPQVNALTASFMALIEASEVVNPQD